MSASADSSDNDKKLLPSEVLSQWPTVDIDDEGVFKYVLIEAYAEDQIDGQVNPSITQHNFFVRLVNFCKHVIMSCRALD